MKVTLRIKRFDPDKDAKPYWAEYTVEASPVDRLLDALNDKLEQGGHTPAR